MARRHRRLGDAAVSAGNWLNSASNNFDRIQQRGGEPCGLVEHYTDVVAEATAAEALAHEASDEPTVQRASKLASKATKEQRRVVRLCRRGK